MSMPLAGTYLVAVLLLSGVAFFNGYPLLYPDSISYIVDSAAVVKALLFREFSDSYGTRSIFYGVSILPFHQRWSLWPVVFMQAWLVAHVLRLSLLRLGVATSAARYLGAVFVVAVLSTAGWQAAVILPDVLAALLILCTFLVAVPGDLSRRQVAAVALLLVYAIVSHLSHLPLAIGLLGALAGARLFAGRSRESTALRLAPIAAAIGGAVVLQLAVHGYLYGRLTLTGSSFPFVLARTVADGTVEPYLRSVCGERTFALCAFRDRLQVNANNFLWSSHGVWQTAAPEQRRQMLDEQTELVPAAVRARPLEQLRASAGNFAQQAVLFGVWDLDGHQVVDEGMKGDVVATGAGYYASRQALGRLHTRWWSRLIYAVVALSVAVAIVAGWRLRGRGPSSVGLFAGLVLAGLAANALITGVLSGPNPRYQARVIWLVPLVAYVLAVTWWDARAMPGPSRKSASEDSLPGWWRPPDRSRSPRPRD